MRNNSINSSNMLSISSKTLNEYNLDSKISASDRGIMMQMKQKLEMIENKLNMLMSDNKTNNDSFKSIDQEDTKILERARSQLDAHLNQINKNQSSTDSYINVFNNLRFISFY